MTQEQQEFTGHIDPAAVDIGWAECSYKAKKNHLIPCVQNGRNEVFLSVDGVAALLDLKPDQLTPYAVHGVHTYPTSDGASFRVMMKEDFTDAMAVLRPKRGVQMGFMWAIKPGVPTPKLN